MHQRQIESEIEFTETLKTITETYQELSALKMQKIRQSVLNTRDFLNEVANVYQQVRISYKRKVEKLAKKQQAKIKKAGSKKALLLLSPNAKLYGDIGKRVFELFGQQDLRNYDLYIFGKVGKELFDQLKLPYQFVYADFPDSTAALGKMDVIFSQFGKYDSINIVFGRYLSLVNQQADVVNINGELIDQTSESEIKKERRFYFEPELESVVVFFNQQISGALLKQSIHESQLAGYAARINTMEEALQNIKSERKRLTVAKRKLFRLKENNKQLEKNSQIYL